MFHEATAEEIEYLFNHPLILPSTGFPSGVRIEMSHALSLPGNVGLVSDIGGIMFVRLSEGVFDSHALFIPGSGGAVILKTAKAMLSEMFTNRGACAIKGFPPRENRAVRVIITALGYTQTADEDFVDDLGRLCSTYEIRK